MGAKQSDWVQRGRGVVQRLREKWRGAGAGADCQGPRGGVGGGGAGGQDQTHKAIADRYGLTRQTVSSRTHPRDYV